MKKAQIEMGETIVVLFVFIILIVIGFVVYVAIQRSNIKDKREEQIGLSANEIAQRVLYLPEIMCSFDNVPKFNCVDKLKLDGIKNIVNNNKIFYYDLFFYSTISVKQIFPIVTSPPIYEIYSNIITDKDNKDISDRKISTQIPITIYDPLASEGDNYYFGLLVVDVYSKVGE